MNLIVCVDKQNGMMFNGRRQSQDSVLRERVLELCSGARLLMNEYSKLQFYEYSDIIVSDDFLQQAEPGDYCFVEDGTLPPLEIIESIFIFNWNRQYPADITFDFDFKANGFKCQKKEEFAGSSHKKITLTIYKRG
jgi:hypothetical protein